MTVHVRTPSTGTPRLLVRDIHVGQSPLAARVNSIRELEYKLTFKHDSTATRITRLRMSATPGMFRTWSTRRKGDVPAGMEFHGTMATMRNDDATKKNKTR